MSEHSYYMARHLGVVRVEVVHLPLDGDQAGLVCRGEPLTEFPVHHVSGAVFSIAMAVFFLECSGEPRHVSQTIIKEPAIFAAFAYCHY